MIDSNSYLIVTTLCLQTLYNCILSVIGQYIYGFYLHTYPSGSQNWTNDVEEKCPGNTTDSSAEIWAQQRSADLIFRMTLWRAFPVMITTYVFGLYASRLNRRYVLLLSILGNGVHVALYQAIIYKHLAEYWWYVSAFIAGLAGGTNVLGIIINLIITESTEENERSSRFVRLGALTTALSAVATFGIGYYIQWRGFTDLFWMAIGLELLSILVVIFFLKSPHSPSLIDETTSLLSSSSADNVNVEVKTPRKFDFRRCFAICTVFISKNRSRKKSIGIILIIVAYMFNLLASSSLSPLLWYLLGAPFCWSSKDLGNFSAVSLISTAIFSVIGMKLLTGCGANDALICALGHICFFGYSLSIALARRSWQLYLSLLINPFSGYQSSLTVPMISKLVETHERDNVFTLVTEINTIILAFGSSFFNWVYARTVIHQKNFTLLLASGLCIVPFILNLCLFVITRRMADEEQDLPEGEEVEPTPFHLSNSVPPLAGEVACLVLPSRSRTNSLSTSHHDRSRANSQSSIDGQTLPTTNLVIL